MKFNPEKHHRRSIRLKGYDYSQNGVYFVTMCIEDRECLFGEIIDNEMQLNDFGDICRNEWVMSGEMRQNFIMDEFVVMPNHFHGILFIDNTAVGAYCHTPKPKIEKEEQIPDINKINYLISCAKSDNDTLSETGKGEQKFNNFEIDSKSLYIPCARAYGNTPQQKGNSKFQSPSNNLGSMIRGFKSTVTKQMNILRQTPGQAFWQRDYFEHIIRNEKDLNRIRKYIINNTRSWKEDSLFN